MVFIGFGLIFIIQAILFYKAGIHDKKMEFSWQNNLEAYTGAILILYALIVYPLLGMYFGHTYPENPTFGLPCPTTIFTFGILLWAKEKLPLYIIIIPVIWAFLGISAAMQLGIKEDLGLLISGLISAILLIKVNVKARKIKTA